MNLNNSLGAGLVAIVVIWFMWKLLHMAIKFAVIGAIGYYIFHSNSFDFAAIQSGIQPLIQQLHLS